MKLLNRIALAVIVLTVLALFLRGLTIKIEPGQTGVLTKEWTGGLEERDFGPGYRWDVGPLHTWHVFDTTVQTMHMNRSKERARVNPAGTQVFEPLLVKSSDGATVTVDLSIKYQIEPGRAWRVYQENGPGDSYKEKVRNEAINVLRISLGRLSTEQFYDPEIRRETAGKMEEALGKSLANMHVRLVVILIRDVQFEEAFEQRIKEKTLAQQDVELQTAQTTAADFRGRTRKIEAETEAKVVVIQQEKEKTITQMRAENHKKVEQLRSETARAVAQVRSDADLFTSIKEAEGVKLLREAEARGQALRREAVSGEGAKVLVALEMARGLNLGAMTVSTQALDPLDLEGLLRRFGLR